MFDVVIPAYNASRFLAETLDAITRQTLLPNKVFVVDDGSTDDTAQIAGRYAPLVTCIQVPNGGQGLARRIAIAQSTAKWIALCDSDDVWNPDHLQRMAELIATYPGVLFAYAEFYSFGPNGNPDYRRMQEAPHHWVGQYLTNTQGSFHLVKDPFMAFLEFNPAFPSGMAFRRDAYERIGGFQEKYSRWIAEDSEFTRRFTLHPDIVVAANTTATWGYRRHDLNYSKVSWKNIYGKARILQEHLDKNLIPTQHVSAVKKHIVLAREKAYDDACWKKDRSGVEQTWPTLPQSSKTFKRTLKWLGRSLL